MAQCQTVQDIIDLTVATLVAQGVCGGNVNNAFGFRQQSSELPSCNVYPVKAVRARKAGLVFGSTVTLEIICAEFNTNPVTCADQVNADSEAVPDALLEDPIWNSPESAGFTCNGYESEFRFGEATDCDGFIGQCILRFSLVCDISYSTRIAATTTMDEALYTLTSGNKQALIEFTE